MAYVAGNPKTKKALKELLASGSVVVDESANADPGTLAARAIGLQADRVAACAIGGALDEAAGCLCVGPPAVKAV
jgi:hypothetical protein